jgi:hypothetical protein
MVCEEDAAKRGWTSYQVGMRCRMDVGVGGEGGGVRGGGSLAQRWKVLRGTWLSDCKTLRHPTTAR